MISYELPFAKTSTGIAALAAKGWAVNVVEVWQTGLPIYMTQQWNPAGVPGASGQLSVHLPGQGDRPNQVGNPVLSHPSVTEWFNTADFFGACTGAPTDSPNCVQLGTEGNTRRNNVYGPHAQHWDMSFTKDFPIQEQMKLQFRVEGFNITNTPSLGLPSSTMGFPGFGAITSTAVGSSPRELQFALRLSF